MATKYYVKTGDGKETIYEGFNHEYAAKLAHDYSKCCGNYYVDEEEIDVEQIVNNYFEENSLTDLMDYGASDDEGLGDISEVVADCLKAIGINVEWYNADDGLGDGKYNIAFGINGETYTDSIKAWNGADEVADIIEQIIWEMM